MIERCRRCKHEIRKVGVRGANDPDGADPCLGILPGVSYACCGHGVEPGYIVFDNGVALYGFDKIKFMKWPPYEQNVPFMLGFGK